MTVSEAAVAPSHERLSDDAFARIRRLMHDRAGIVIPTDDAFHVTQRLGSVAARTELSLEELAHKACDDTELTTQVIEAVTNTETMFFRDGHPFDTIGTVLLPKLAALCSSSEDLRVWCAAVASGQEAYSVAMTALEHAEHRSWNLHIDGTDVSQRMIDRAQTARYSDLETNRGLDSDRRARWFDRHEQHYSARPALRTLMAFRQFDLRESWSSIAPMHLILLRNILIYLDGPTRESIVKRAADQLVPGGFLLLGAVETLRAPPAGLERRIVGKTLCYERVR